MEVPSEGEYVVEIVSRYGVWNIVFKNGDSIKDENEGENQEHQEFNG